jgi:hypothetical protein
MNLFDLIPIWTSLVAAALGVLAVLFLLKARVIHSLADPLLMVLFQSAFTFFILMISGLLQIEDAAGFIIFVLLISRYCHETNSNRPLIPVSDWAAFVKVSSVVLLLVNVYLIKQKGLLILSDDLGVARGEFYEGWGLFRRFNEVGIGLVMITSALLWDKGEKKVAALMALFSGLLTLTLGSRGGLMTCFFAFGAYLHFQKKPFSNYRIAGIAGVLAIPSLGWFYLMFGPSLFYEFGYRLLAFCDGPFYYFYDRMYRYSGLPLSYPFDILLVNLRIHSAPSFESLGDFVIGHHFGIVIDKFGPNPQMFVESHALFQKVSILWYFLLAGLFLLSRRIPATPYSFFLSCFIVGPALVDSQYAASQVFTVAMVMAWLSFFLGCRWVVGNACLGVQRDLAVGK